MVVTGTLGPGEPIAWGLQAKRHAKGLWHLTVELAKMPSVIPAER